MLRPLHCMMLPPPYITDNCKYSVIYIIFCQKTLNENSWRNKMIKLFYLWKTQRENLGWTQQPVGESWGVLDMSSVYRDIMENPSHTLWYLRAIQYL